MFDVIVKKIFFILLIFAISSCDFTPAEEYYNRAISLEKQERWEEAIINLDKAIIYYSEALETEGATRSFTDSNGGIFGIQKNLDFNRFDSDMDYNMHDSEIYFYRGIEYLELEKFDNAISDINKSLKANFAKRDCYFLLGEAYLGKKDSITSCQYFIKSARLGDKEAREMLKKHCI